MSLPTFAATDRIEILEALAALLLLLRLVLDQSAL